MTRERPTPAEVGARIVALREQLGFTTGEFAASADVFSPVSEERLLSIEAGAEAGTMRELLSIAWAMRCSLAGLLDSSDGATSTVGADAPAEALVVRRFDPDDPI